ncbi:ATP-binding protein [[Clostridium] fimetarium]|uniref:AAA domain-containing protein n=1 Tax=[Clostridium] fimetarium TaxID=99656 RepID=A0A1I0MUI8_9FIRM|nr:AAA family ATPase [[Clostridium] fimetarium]SEV92034.1 AAA domain-containing protein [[Clostridium] fimetarium]
MIIQYLKLNNFGRFNNKEISLSNGINIIYGENEAGKTTLHSFIRAMFFGAARSRGRAAANDVYSQYEPWENPGFYEGSMEFLARDRKYRIDRVFQKNVKNMTLTDRNIGSVVLLGDRGLETVIEGLSEESFYNTISVSQEETGIDGIIANLNMSKSADINVKEALESLNESRRKLDKKRQSLGIEELESRLKEYEKLDEKIRLISEKRASANERMNQRVKIIPEIQNGSNNKSNNGTNNGTNNGINNGINSGVFLQKIGVILPIFALIFGYCFVQLHNWYFLTAAVICVLADMLLIYGTIKMSVGNSGKKNNENTNDNITGNKESESNIEILKQIERLDWELDSAITLSNRRDQLMEELAESNLKIEEIDKKIRSITLAIATIQNFSKDIGADFGDSLNELASEYISRFTRGKYDNLRVNSSMKVTISEDGRVINMNNVSFATKEQIHLSVRLAASKLLFPNEIMPIILDESFAHYDDSRLEDTLLSLASMGNQIIIFTCTKREIAILKKEEIKFQLVTLG